MKKPAIVVGYQHKSKGILEALGLSSLFAGNFHEVSSEKLISAANYLMQNREQYAEEICNVMTKARNDIKKTFSEEMNRIF